MKQSLLATLISSTFVLSLGAVNVSAQDSVPATAAENSSNLWFVEFSSLPAIEGTSLTTLRSEKSAFRSAAAKAGIRFTERMSFDTLFNGMSIQASAADRAKIAQMPGVKAIYPVDIIQAPTPEQSAGAAPDLASAIAMTGANVAQNSLGLTGAGVKVGIIDSGVDIDHPAFGGNGTNGSTPFPTARIIAGYDFVGDAYNSSGTPAQQVAVPDPNPDDCGGHGTHVAGIVGANGGGIKGVAPGVSFGAYRVFGCDGTTSADIMIAAMERAYADGMQVINQSIGSARQWPQYPTAQAATRLVNKGVVMVASTGNNGPGGSSPDALFAAGAPGLGAKVIAVASFDNVQSTQLAFTVNPGDLKVGFNSATGAPPAPTSGTVPISAPAVATGCAASDFAGFPAGAIALVARGVCTFHIKAATAQAAGAAAMVLYNNAAGALSPTVVGAVPITIPVVAITQAEGLTIAGIPGATLTWGTSTVSSPVATGGLISGFSSFGLAADLSFKPNIGAPGGLIYSSYPLELGAYATLSGTSMSSPHVAGAAALILQARPKTPSNAMKGLMQNSADPKNWSGSPSLGFLDFTFRQGAGMIDIVGAIQAKTSVEPSEIALGESEAGPQTITLTVKNSGSTSVTYDLSHAAALASGPNLQAQLGVTPPASYNTTGTFNAPATVSFSAPSVTVSAGASATVDVTIAANAGLVNRGLYGGYVVLTPQGGGDLLRVPYAGFKGDYQSTVVLTTGSTGFPVLGRLNAAGTSYALLRTASAFTMVGNDYPSFLLHLDHQARRILIEAREAASGKSWYRVSDDEYVGRNSTPNGFFAFAWDATTFAGKGKNGSQQYTVPNGDYIVTVSVLKPLGDESNPAHWETWTSPVITIARP